MRGKANPIHPWDARALALARVRRGWDDTKLDRDREFLRAVTLGEFVLPASAPYGKAEEFVRQVESTYRWKLKLALKHRPPEKVPPFEDPEFVWDFMHWVVMHEDGSYLPRDWKGAMRRVRAKVVPLVGLAKLLHETRERGPVYQVERLTGRLLAVDGVKADKETVDACLERIEKQIEGGR